MLGSITMLRMWIFGLMVASDVISCFTLFLDFLHDYVSL